MTYQIIHCSRYGLEGHNMNRCSGQVVDPMPLNWVIISERYGLQGHCIVLNYIVLLIWYLFYFTIHSNLKSHGML